MKITHTKEDISMSKKPVLVVMAAGMGSRYGGLKQIDPVGSQGEAILDYSVYDAHEAGFETVVIIIKEAIKKDFMDTVGARLAKAPVEIRYAYQELDKLPEGYTAPADRVKPWGTCHAVLCAKGFLDLEDVKQNFSRFGSQYIGHPNNKLPGIEMNSGSLGHGLPVCVGMALAGKMDKKDYRVYTVMGDGELAEGSVWEAAMAGSHYKPEICSRLRSTTAHRLSRWYWLALIAPSHTLPSASSPSPMTT